MSQFPAEQSKSGAFKRQEDAFRDWVRRDGSTPYKPERDRYHLYVSLACPWAHRTIILRLKGLEETIGMTVADPVRDDRGWAFRDGPGHSTDPVNGFNFLSEAYQATDSNHPGRVTVPDWRLFPTLIRFDAVYHGHFKCNLRRIVDYPNLWPYLRDLYRHEGVAETVNFDHIKRHYYMTHEQINPTRIVPIGPTLSLIEPHRRETL